MKSSFKMFIAGVWVCTFSLSFLFSSANNIRISGMVKVSQETGDTLVLSFPLRWDNSWRDQFNWDAAWVFLKYKSGTGGWNHVNLCAGGHRFVDGSGLPVPFDCMAGTTGSNTVGLFVYRNSLEAGNTPEITCRIKCLKSSLGGLAAEKFTSHEGFVLAQAVEMVYVPYGAYYLGDGGCSDRFAGSDKKPVLIDNEDAITASTVTKVYPVTNNVMGSAQSVAAAYPKGYKGFYMMKYEVSQEQWVYFLNTLTYVQQQERVPGLSGLKSGEYIFGSKSTPNNRNGIIVNVESNGSGSAIFANNLNNNPVYAEDGDGKTIACNYLSPSDMLAYCSWAGLRPMSELEYEKACRSSYPEQPIKGEYAWHDSSIIGRLNAVSNSGMRNERSATASANVNAGNHFGPVRCGLFATGSSTQQSAGVAFWGGMELCGNVKELCYNIAYTGFNGSTMGAGTYNTALWSVAPAYFGVKGGGFTSSDSLLRVSDRTETNNYFTAIEQRDSTVGFRGVRTIGNEITITQGQPIARQNGVIITGTACPDIQLDLITDVEAKVMSGSNQISNMAISYVWYVLKPGATVDSIIPGVTGAVLSYNDLKVVGTVASVTYKFRRKAICPVGESMTDYISFTVPNLKIVLTPGDVSVDTCDFAPTVTASAYCSNPVFSWNYEGREIKTGKTYIPSRSDINGAGNLAVDVIVNSGGCTMKQELKVYIPYIQEVAAESVTLANCGKVLAVDGRDGQRYCTAKIGERCWMAKNFNFDKNRYCVGNQLDNCRFYGGLYERPTVDAGNLCPPGWYVPTTEDWQAIDAIPSVRLKSPLWCSGCGESGFNAILAGVKGVDGSDINDGRSRWHTSSNLNSTYLYRRLGSENYIMTWNDINIGSKYKFSVRCIREF